LQSASLEAADVALFIKREDLVDAELGGNKWRKLKYNLEAAQQQKHDTLLTFGGAYSNHIYATAAAGQRYGYKTIGIIRGEQHAELNPTLQFATDCGMQLDYVDRESYRNKTSNSCINQLHKKYGRFYLLPEGGSNVLALKGCAEIIDEIDTDFDVICVACGTGATLAGLVSNLSGKQQALGFVVLKDADFISTDIKLLLQQANINPACSWQVNTSYHFGGYAKTDQALWDFMARFKKDFDIELDAVYTGKMFYGLFDLINNGYFKPGTRIVAIHTGGLQGNKGFSPQMNANKRK